MENTNQQFWGYRIENTSANYFYTELITKGYLRQGWGYDNSLDLKNFTNKTDLGAKRNFPIFHRVKKGDILLVPRLNGWSKVGIVEATDDFNKGYKFEIGQGQTDFGHCFPAKFIKSFDRHNKLVDGKIRSTLKNISRFWNVNHCKDEIIKLIDSQEDLGISHDHNSKFEANIMEIFNDVFQEKDFSNRIFEKLNTTFQASEWENILIYGLQKLLPYYKVERIGGKTEVNHGSDILIIIPSFFEEYDYAVVIQVKDYQGFVNNDVITQISKADSYFQETQKKYKLIEKIILITESSEKENDDLIKKCEQANIKVMFKDDTKKLLTNISKQIIGNNIFEY